MTKKHILVADDEENMLHTMGFILEVANYKITTAKNGQEALRKILMAQEAGNPVDLLIADVQMPLLSGLELLDELNCLNIDIPILVITGYANKEMVRELVNKGCNGYLNKPFDEEELVKRVDMLFEQKSYRKDYI